LARDPDASHLSVALHELETRAVALSIALVRQWYGGEPRDCTMVRSVAMLARGPGLEWLTSTEFLRRLDCVVHCAELFLVHHRLTSHPTDDAPALTFEEYSRYLSSQTQSPVSEILFWRQRLQDDARLLRRQASPGSWSDAPTHGHPDGVPTQPFGTQDGLAQLIRETTELLEQDLLIGIDDLPESPVDVLVDDPLDIAPHASFLDHPLNRLHDIRSCVTTTPTYRRALHQHFLGSDLTSAAADPHTSLQRTAIAAYRQSHQHFLQRLGVACTLTALPPVPEGGLTRATWRNDHRPRTLLLQGGLVALHVDGASDHEDPSITAATVHVLPAEVSRLVTRYLIYAYPIVELISDLSGRSPPPAQLFHSDDGLQWTVGMLTGYVERHTWRVRGASGSSRRWVCLASAIDHRLESEPATPDSAPTVRVDAFTEARLPGRGRWQRTWDNDADSLVVNSPPRIPPTAPMPSSYLQLGPRPLHSSPGPDLDLALEPATMRSPARSLRCTVTFGSSAPISASFDPSLGAQDYAGYARRLDEWGTACIPCSRRARRHVHDPHPECLRDTLQVALGAFKRGLNLDRFVGCFRCVQPVSICTNRGRRGCRYPELIRHSCYVAMAFDADWAREVVVAMGGPDLSQSDPAHPPYLHWLGKKDLLWGKEASNAARLTQRWLDRLHLLCTPRRHRDEPA
jgi:hypothetical protein